MTAIGLVSPGAMGAAVGAAAASNRHEILWAGQGRSAATHQRAVRAGFTDCGDLDSLVDRSAIIVSICPPHDALNVAKEVARRKFGGLFVEGNAIAPRTARQIQEILVAAGAKTVDGGLVGGPPGVSGADTCFYLSGLRAPEVADLFTGSLLGAEVISDSVGAASAMKMCFAAYTKGSTALVTAILGVASCEGVRATLEKQWGEQFTRRAHERAIGSSAKAWRFAGEMRETAATFEAAGFPGGFHRGAAEIFERLAPFKDKPADNLEALLKELLKQAGAGLS